ncbi:MAG: HAD family hydrolase [Pseudomonadales bacterium]|nr:HAD family hydrolase [Pseudomonadales bacterium]
MKPNFSESPIKLISFDLDDTLWHGQQAVAAAQQALHDWLEKHHPLIAKEALSGRYLELRKEVSNDFPEQLHNLTFIRKEILYRLFQENSATENQALKYAESAFDVFFKIRNQVNYFEGALSTIKQLRTNFQIAALTNGNADINATGLTAHIDHFYSAEIVGAAKPNPKMFRLLLEDTGIKPAQCIHIGDHPEHDVLTAQSLGINTIWFNTLRKKWPEKSGPEKEVQTFSQLPQAIHDICLHHL